VELGLAVELGLMVGLAVRVGEMVGVRLMVAVGVADQLGVLLGVMLGVQFSTPTTSSPAMVALLLDEVIVMMMWPLLGVIPVTVTS